MRFPSVWQVVRQVAGRLLPEIQKPNQKLNVGIFNENMGSNPQMEFYTQTYKPVINTSIDSSHLYEAGRGEIIVPASMDYYTGEVL
jgi:dihydroxyacetone kinase